MFTLTKSLLEEIIVPKIAVLTYAIASSYITSATSLSSILDSRCEVVPSERVKSIVSFVMAASMSIGKRKTDSIGLSSSFS